MEELFNPFNELEEVGFFQFNEAKVLSLVEEEELPLPQNWAKLQFELELEEEEKRAQEEALKEA